MEGRLTVCNMSIEAGARAGLVAPDDVDVRATWRAAPHAPSGAALGDRAGLLARRCPPTPTRRSTTRSPWTPPTLTPYVTWGTNPGQAAAARRRRCRTRGSFADPGARAAAERALTYMDLKPGHRARATSPWTRCSSARAPTAGSRTCGPPPRCCAAGKVAPAVRMLVVPGSMAGAGRRPRQEGLDAVFTAAGAEWRSAGCSMCLGMNPDKLAPGRAQRVDLQPQLRGPPGQGRAHPPGLARRSPPPPP